MNPTVGRIVHYFPTPADYQQIGGKITKFVPAIIVDVHSETCVNLKVFTNGPKDIWVENSFKGQQIRNWDWPQIK